jgi:predicted CopG family antitoxin
MRKKLTLTIDAEVYDMIKDLPRKVSISEVVSWVLKGMFQEIKKGGLTEEEFDKWIKSTPEGRDFKERAREHLGPKIRKMDASIEGIKKKIKPKRTKK